MSTEKKTIPDSYYYDGKKKKWNYEYISNYPVVTPSERVLLYWLNEWENSKGYPQQETALDKLFIELLPNNTELNDVLIKVCTLNDFYSTNIYNVFDVASIIVDMDVDSRLKSDVLHPELVDEFNNAVFQKANRHIYSFASKYFSHHKPSLYPIYDSYVDKILRYYRDELEFYTFKNTDLLSYSSFCKIISKFREYFKLEHYSVKDIDKMLWQMGKYYFPKYTNN